MSEVPPFRSGQALSRRALNRLVDAANRANAVTGGRGIAMSRTEGGTIVGRASAPEIEFVEVQQHLSANVVDGTTRVLRRDMSASPGTDPFEDTTENLSNLIDTTSGPWLAGSRLATLWLPGAGQRIPLATIQWHLGELDDVLEAGESAQVSLWSTATPSGHEDTGLDVTAHDWMLETGESLPAGSRVVVLQHLASRQWYVVRALGKRVDVIRFRLTATLPLGGSAAAARVDWNGSTYVDGPSVTVHDFSGNTFLGAVDDEGMAAELADRPGVFEILWLKRPTAPVGTLTRFELIESLFPGGEADANTLDWSGSAYTTGDSIVVRDFTSPGFWRGEPGHQGWAVSTPDRGDYEIVWMERLAERIEGTLAEDLGYQTAGEAAASVDLFYRGLDPGATVQVVDSQDQFGAARSGARYKASWDDVENRYLLTSCELPARYIRFTLDSWMLTHEALKQVVIRDSWDGMAWPDGQAILAYNPPNEAAPGEYIFEGEEGATGTAVFDPEENKYWMQWVQCPSREPPEATQANVQQYAQSPQPPL